MCGLVAVLQREAPVDPGVLRAMGAALAHRGPDGVGQHLDGGVGLHHRRLAVIDPEGSPQPMHDPEADVWVVFNGALYDYVEHRAALEAAGRRLRTRGDTEVLLHLYALHGADFPRHLNGVFAFALYDRRRRRLVAGRDRFGVKPLYRLDSGEALLYASEIKALLQHPAVTPEVDPEGLQDYLTFQHTLGTRSLFRGIHAVQPGTVEITDLRGGGPRIHRFWRHDFEVDTALDADTVVERVRGLLDDAVRLQLRCDVPLGTYLSGGLDSSVVSALAARRVRGPLRCFHGHFGDARPRYDERAHARAVARSIGADLTEVRVGPEHLLAELPGLIHALDQPAAGPGLIPQAVLARAARAQVKVVLGGQGGDELFCGYTRYLVGYLEQALKGAIRGTDDEGEHVVTLRSILPNLPFLRGYEPMMQRFWGAGLFGDMDRRYFALLDRGAELRACLSPAARADHDGAGVFERFQAIFHRPDTASYIHKMRCFDRVASLPALLHVEDRVSMAASLEARVPLLDHRLAALLDHTPPRVLFGGGRLKHLLREAAAGWLPESARARKDKMGFPFPLGEWLRGPARALVEDTLLDRRARERGLVEPRRVRALLDAPAPFSRALWGLLCLELWHRTFMDGDLPAPRSET